MKTSIKVKILIKNIYIKTIKSLKFYKETNGYNEHTRLNKITIKFVLKLTTVTTLSVLFLINERSAPKYSFVCKAYNRWIETSCTLHNSPQSNTS